MCIGVISLCAYGYFCIGFIGFFTKTRDYIVDIIFESCVLLTEALYRHVSCNNNANRLLLRNFQDVALDDCI